MMTTDKRRAATSLALIAIAGASGGAVATLALAAPPGAESKPAPQVLAASAEVSYAREIHPLLMEQCGDCHAGETKLSGFDVSTREALLKGGKKFGASVIPGQPDQSPLVRYITGELKPRMPKGGDPLSAEQIERIRQWIASGAKTDAAGQASAVGPDSAATPNKSQAASAEDVAAGKAELRGLLDQQMKNAVEQIKLAQAAKDARVQAALFDESGLGEVDKTQMWALRRKLRLARLTAAPTPPRVAAAANNPIDQFIAASWKQAKLPQASQSPSLCSDEVFLRRVYLDVIGVIPTGDEVQSFVYDRAKDKRARLIEQLLGRKADYAAHWTPFWEDALGRGGETGGIKGRGNYRDWAFKNFEADTPFDEMVAGLIDPALPIPGKASYIVNGSHQETTQTAANIAQVFMGTGMKCASCHNHFLNTEWPQKRFTAYASMFSPADLEIIRCESKTGKFAPARFAFDVPDAPTDAPTAEPARYARLAQLLTDPSNPRFAKSIVNRLWKRYLGLGLFEPADDFRSDTPASHPELLDWLAAEFMRHDYSIKYLTRLILNSRTYQLRYDPKLEDHFDIAKPGAPRFYRSPSLRRLSAEQFIDSVRVAGEGKMPPARAYLDSNSTALTRALGKPAARIEVSTARPDDVAVVQALELLNGSQLHGQIYSAKLVAELSKEKNLAPLVDRLYRSVLSREPSAGELSLATKYLQRTREAEAAAPEGFRQAVGDLMWALVVSPEFQYVR